MTTEGSTDGAAVDAPAAETGEGTRTGTGEEAPTRRARLEEEGDVAADYLEELLDIADLDGDLDIDVEDGRASVSVLEDDAAPGSLRRLVGDDGRVLEALQELTRLAVQARTGERSRLVLDVAGYRAQRRVVLTGLANEAVEQARAGGEAVHLEPMNPYERKIVHDAVAEAGLRSESEGVAADRHVVVTAAS
ncbi:R3H domain-containing nucleic acid-binding protein [Pseudokineococcus marinus]|uniref:Single-stranded DNA-binding protein n=1 Tax=Pseudokineococcus marinus TaxID=351215 RepID=A0A849BN24_9ACTN|nr:R3H domain-containing nucleic acid-binding protein [Pseudokineococcus marinus]NNH24061.1 single-stranded DNA-binding protein [Pseudokineococcus marinus]